MKEAILEWLGHVALAALIGLLFLLYLEATPDQLSGEADLHEAELERLGLNFKPCY